MLGTLFFRIAVAVAVAAALGGVLVAVAGADDTKRLPDLTAPELLARMGDASRAPAAVSGDVSWTNELFGALPFTPDHVAEPARSPLTASGSGRLWAQGGKVRFEAQGQGGDLVAVADPGTGTLSTYSFADDTARVYELRGAEARAQGGEAGGLQARPAPSPPTPERVSRALRAAARFMSVEVSRQTVVAGRASYVLTMTPAAADTALGRVEAAVDGETYVPLRVDVFAAGQDAPTLSFRFGRVSFAPVDDTVFAFTPPPGATVETRAVGPGDQPRASAPAAGRGDAAGGSAAGAAGDRADAERDGDVEHVRTLARRALLTRAQAAVLVDFDLAWARASTERAFRWAYVFEDGAPVDALGAHVFGAAGLWPASFGSRSRDGDAGDGRGDAADSSARVTGTTAVLLYGEGFGSVVLAQTKTTAAVREQLRRLPETVERLDLGGLEARAVMTPLGGVVVWERDGVTLLAGGMVPRDDLVRFAQSVR